MPSPRSATPTPTPVPIQEPITAKPVVARPQLQRSYTHASPSDLPSAMLRVSFFFFSEYIFASIFLTYLIGAKAANKDSFISSF